MELWQYVSYGAAILVGWVVANYLQPLVAQHVALRRDLLINYLVPYKRWCRTLYKELTEFEARYKDKEVYDSLSNTLIIIDYRELHDVIRDAGNYRGKVRAGDSTVADYLEQLEHHVDNLWHGLQDEFQVNFDQLDHDAWLGAIIEYPDKDKIVGVIREKSGGIIEHFQKEQEFRRVTKYLEKQTPKWW